MFRECIPDLLVACRLRGGDDEHLTIGRQGRPVVACATDPRQLLRVVEGAKAALNITAPSLPPSVRLTFVYDLADFVRKPGERPRRDRHRRPARGVGAHLLPALARHGDSDRATLTSSAPSSCSLAGGPHIRSAPSLSRSASSSTTRSSSSRHPPAPIRPAKRCPSRLSGARRAARRRDWLHAHHRGRLSFRSGCSRV